MDINGASILEPILQLVFQLSNDQGKFSINNQGYITLLDSLDRETRSSYNISVTVSDRGQQPLSATDYLYIEVTDVNDVRPQLDRVSQQGRGVVSGREGAWPRVWPNSREGVWPQVRPQGHYHMDA